jgi:hypothetical protein
MEAVTTQWVAGRGWLRPLPAWDGPRTLVIVFAGRALLCDPAPLREIADAYCNSYITGCSTAGEILDETVSDETVTVAVVRFQSTEIRVVSEPVASPHDSYEVGTRIGARLRELMPDLTATFVLSDGLVVNGGALVAGLADGTSGEVTITGGLAGDGSHFERSWVIVDGRPVTAHVTAVGLSGDNLGVGHGSQGGWDRFGPERQVTRSAGNVLLELDRQPALALYKKYLGERAEGLPATALLFPAAAGQRPVVRTILAVDEAAQSMTFAGDVPEGAIVQLMSANLERLIDGAQDAMANAVTDAVAPVLALAISCVGRRLVLGARCEDELEAAYSVLPEHSGMVGFYSYGEIDAGDRAGSCELQNQTMTVTTLWETP